MKLKSKQIVKDKIHPYWADETLSIREQTTVSNFVLKKFKIELKQETGYFVEKPNQTMLYRTYIRIYKDNKLLKRRLFYIDNPDWKQFVHDFIKLNG